MIERSLAAIGEVEHQRKSHKKGPGPVRPRCLPPEDLVHEKVETVRRGESQRIHFICSNPKCAREIRNDKWDAHVSRAKNDKHLQQAPDDVLERSMNFAPDGARGVCEQKRAFLFLVTWYHARVSIDAALSGSPFR